VRRHFPSIQIATLLTALLASACASSPASSGGASSTNQGATAFGNFLVVAIADNYTNRAQYERTLVSLLKVKGASATAYYQAIGGNKPVDRDAVREVLAANSYDAVLVTRVLNTASQAELKSGSAAAKVTRREDRPLDFFRYDYEELDEPGSLEIRTEAMLASQLYRANDENVVWSMETSSKGADNIGQIIDEVAEKVVNRLRRDGHIAK